jgi:hypothetical protein
MSAIRNKPSGGNAMTTWKTVPYGCCENPGCYDIGNGSLAFITENAAYPGIERVKVSFYAKGRGRDHTYYRFASEAAGGFIRAGCRSYSTLRAALDAQIHPRHVRCSLT